MSTHVLGPDNGTLTVKTGKRGPASKAGHNLVMEVESWNATLDAGDEPSIALTADAHSFRVVTGSGGPFELGEEEEAAIPQTIREEVLTDPAIEFRSTFVEDREDGTMNVEGELQLMGNRQPIAFELTTGDGRLTGHAIVKQTDWDMKPYTALFGTLKVADEVEVEIDAKLERSDESG